MEAAHKRAEHVPSITLLAVDGKENGSDAEDLGIVLRKTTPSPSSWPRLPLSASFVSTASDNPEAGNITLNTTTSTPRPAVVNRKESYKAQRQSYAIEKKRVERELLSTFKDQSIVVLADWLKVRGTLKGWTKLWCVLKPGLLLLYRSQKQKSGHWIGTIILSTCELMERPSKKDGFCFKLFHPMDQSIWAARGPEGETLGAVVQPLPSSHLIFRAPTSAAGKCWMDALELALRCSSLLLRTMTVRTTSSGSGSVGSGGGFKESHDASAADNLSVGTNTLNDSDAENHFGEELDDEFNSSNEMVLPEHADSDEEEEEDDVENNSDYSEDNPFHELEPLAEAAIVPSRYIPDPREEVFGTARDQTEEFSDENKSIVWFLVKQVRPGMDLSRVVLPTFILEPRSFLDKLSDYYFHADHLSRAVQAESPLERMRTVVRWYLSGFYKKPKGLKKPYNPILGETFRCYWEHPTTATKTFYIAEQVSHHPPISAFYVTNRQEGFTLTATILAKSKFYGNSTSAILDGTASLMLLPRGEEYQLTMPYAHCKGILMGNMTMELGGKVTIECPKTGYSTELEFKLRPFLGGGEFTNAVSGKIRLGKETLETLDGRWDDSVTIRDKKNGTESVLWQVTEEVISSRLKRFTIPMEEQSEFESARLWQRVSKAIENDDQDEATRAKTELEDAQRAAAKERKERGDEWQPKYFIFDSGNDRFEYRYSDLRPWDQLNDLYQFEANYAVQTHTKHRTPLIRAQSIISVTDASAKAVAAAASASGTGAGASGSGKVRRRRTFKEKKLALASTASDANDSAASTVPEDVADGARANVRWSSSASKRRDVSLKFLEEALRPLEAHHKRAAEQLERLQRSVDVMAFQQRERRDGGHGSASHTASALTKADIFVLVVVLAVVQALVHFWLMAGTTDHARSLPPSVQAVPPT